MIISLHVPKTAGTSFQHMLQQAYGDRLLLDYGDWLGDNSAEAIARREERTAETRGRRDELLEKYDAIHGHFMAEKYLGLFPRAEFVAFFRDPYQQTISNYYFLKRHPEAGDRYPAVKAFHDANLTLEEYAAWKAVRDPQAHTMTGLTVDDLAVVGLLEEFDRGIALFNRVFGTTLVGEARHNINERRAQAVYPVSDELRALIDANREKDIEHYRRAQERFASLAARYGV